MTSLKDAIDEVLHTYASTVNAGDIDGWIALWINDGIQMFPDAPPNKGKENIRTFFQGLFDSVTFSNMIVNSEEVREAGDWGFARGNFSIEGTSKEGETIKRTGKFLTILEKQDDGSWKIAREIANYNAPVPQA